MPTLNLDPGFFGHRKTKRLIDLLGKGSEVIPIRVWCYACRYHGDDGMLTGYTAQEIESQVAWWGQSGKAVEAMVTVGFLDVVPGGWKVHDWEEWAGHIVRYHLRAKKAASARWASKGGNDATSMQQACNKHANALHCTESELKIENDSFSRNGHAVRVGAGYFAFLVPDAKAIVDAYQREVGTAHPPAGAQNAVLEILGNSEATKDDLLRAIKAWAPACKRANADPTKRMSAAKWFRDGCWRDFINGNAVVNDPDAAAKARAAKERAEMERRLAEDAEGERKKKENPLPEDFSFVAELERRKKLKRQEIAAKGG